MATLPIITFSIFLAMFVIFTLQKIEYEIETKETMQREQKVIVLKTMYCCNVLCEDKRLRNWVSDARKHHSKVVISQNFPCGAGREKPPPPPSPSPASSLRRHRFSFFGCRLKGPFFMKMLLSHLSLFAIWQTPFIIHIWLVEWRYELRLLYNCPHLDKGCKFEFWDFDLWCFLKT